MIAAYRHHGAEVPAGLVPPELQDIEHGYWGAFWDLSGDRQDGGPIPWTATRHYFTVDGFGDFHTFRQIISTMDSVYLKSRNSK